MKLGLFEKRENDSNHRKKRRWRKGPDAKIGNQAITISDKGTTKYHKMPPFSGSTKELITNGILPFKIFDEEGKQ